VTSRDLACVSAVRSPDRAELKLAATMGPDLLGLEKDEPGLPMNLAAGCSRSDWSAHNHHSSSSLRSRRHQRNNPDRKATTIHNKTEET